MSSEKPSSENSLDYLSGVSFSNDNLVKMLLQSTSPDEESTDDEADANVCS